MTENQKDLIKRTCADCARNYYVRPSSKKFICPVCEAGLEAQGIKNVKQPVDKSLYVPRFDGVKPFDREE